MRSLLSNGPAQAENDRPKCDVCEEHLFEIFVKSLAILQRERVNKKLIMSQTALLQDIYGLTNLTVTTGSRS